MRPKPALAGKRFPYAPARSLRGERGRRVPKGKLGTWESHPRGRASARYSPLGNHNWQWGRGRQSERPIVATKRVTTVEQRGLRYEGAESEERVA
jgi:hypothetical protein